MASEQNSSFFSVQTLFGVFPFLRRMRPIFGGFKSQLTGTSRYITWFDKFQSFKKELVGFALFLSFVQLFITLCYFAKNLFEMWRHLPCDLVEVDHKPTRNTLDEFDIQDEAYLLCGSTLFYVKKTNGTFLEFTINNPEQFKQKLQITSTPRKMIAPEFAIVTEHTTHERPKRDRVGIGMQIALMSVGIPLAILNIVSWFGLIAAAGPFILGIGLAQGLIDDGWDLATQIHERYFGNGKKDQRKIKSLKESLKDKLRQNIDIKDDPDLKELTRAIERQRKCNKKLVEYIHKMVVTIVVSVAYIFTFTPLAPIGLIILTATSSYGLLNALKINPFQLARKGLNLLLKKITGKELLNPFAKKGLNEIEGRVIVENELRAAVEKEKDARIEHKTAKKAAGRNGSSLRIRRALNKPQPQSSYSIVYGSRAKGRRRGNHAPSATTLASTASGIRFAPTSQPKIAVNPLAREEASRAAQRI